MSLRVAFVGAGRWGLCLARHLHELGIETTMWEPNDAYLHRLIDTRRHPDLPPEAEIPPDILISGDRDAVLADARIVLYVTPSQALESAALDCAPAINQGGRVVVTAAKGIIGAGLERPTVVLQRCHPGVPTVVLAGPGIPYDFAAGDPTSLVAASENPEAADEIRDLMSGANLRVYSSVDVVGVEVAASLKNVYATGAGIAEGLGLGLNARAALLTRGLAEAIRLGVAMNANPMTFAGLAGAGDLMVTAFSTHSRNHRLGVLVGSGVPVADAAQQLNGVAEGVNATSAAHRLATRHRIEMPIVEELYQILHNRRNPGRSLRRLLSRKLRKETQN